MSDALRLFGMTWVLTQAGSMLMLHVGSRFAGHPLLLRLGTLAHRQKLQALDSVWPLTRLRRALERRDHIACTAILGSLIALKSVGCLALGIVVVFWLPAASLFVPTIVAVHDPDDTTLMPWVRRVATLQITSHALAASVGFMLVRMGPASGTPLRVAIESNAVLACVAMVTSLALAVAAGRVEALGIMERGI